jgi:inorganic pyrophosphatase
LDTISRHRLREIEHFFDIYKELEGKPTKVDGWHGLDETHALIREDVAAYEKRRQAAP